MEQTNAKNQKTKAATEESHMPEATAERAAAGKPKSTTRRETWRGAAEEMEATNGGVALGPDETSAGTPPRSSSRLPKAPPASSEAVRKSMQGNKRRDTKPELLVRKMLRDMGYPGYRLDWKKAHGHPDIAYPGRKIAIYVMGCFWHHHEGCKYASTPKQNVEYWQAKFARNKQRDAEVRAAMEADGWHVVEIWECELKRDQLESTRARLQSEIRYAFVEL